MKANDRLEQLLDLWMADRDCGIIRTATEICTETPELVEELSRRIEIVRRFEHLAGVDHSETLVSQGSVDTSHLTNAPVPAALKPTTMPGSIGPFRPLELLGEGGMGAVYLAEDPQLGRRVAVKVMKKELAADPDARHRFLREARAMATVEHDNIMTIYAVGEDQGVPYLVMPVLKGETLDDRLRREIRLSADETRRIGEEIAAGLAAAHSHGLIHRDIKPSNIWLEGTQGRVRILDFGLARPASDDQKVTHSGAVLGTPAYMAPEQAAGAAATPRSDLFSLGAVLYRMTTGVQPFAGPNIMATLSNLANKLPESPRKICPEVPDSLSELILRLIAKSPEHRPESAAIVVEALQPTLETAVPHFTFSPLPVPSRKKPAGRPSVDRPLNKVASCTRPPRTFRKALAAGFAGFLVLMSIIVYRIQTDKGVLILSIDDEQVAAKLTKGGLEIEDAKTGRTWTIKPDQPESVSSGEYKISPPDGLLLYVTDDTGTEFTTAEFKIKRGDQITVRVTREEPEGSVVVNPEWNGWPKDAPAPAIAPFDSAQAKRHQEEWAKHLGVPVEYTNSIGMKFVLIPPGEFLMGSTSAEIEDLLTQIADAVSMLDRLQLESPQHRVVLTKAFYLGVHEVTQAQFAGVMGNNPSFLSSTGGGKDLVLQIDTSAYPVEQVSWNDTTEFCRRLSLQENVVPATSEPNRDSTTPNGKGYWLPTEAEWEFACRAGTTTWFWNGNEIENLKTSDLFGPTTGQVGQLKANPFGVHDLHGNVCEFVHDCWNPDSYKKHSGEPAIDPIGSVPEEHASTLYRGSHWTACGESARSAARKVGYERSAPGVSHIGFRVTLSWQTVHQMTTRSAKDQHTGSSGAEMKSQAADVSPLSFLDGKQIPAEERTPDLPPETVAVLGSSHGKTWGSPYFTTHGNMAYSPDGKWIVECDFSSVYLFDADTLALKKRFPFVGHFLSGRWASFSSDSRTLFLATQVNAAGSGNSVTDLMSPELNTTHDSVGFGYSYVIANSRDDNWIAINSVNENEVQVGHRDTTTNILSDMRPIPGVPGLPSTSDIGRVVELAFSPDGKWLISGHSTGENGGYRVLRRQGEDFVPVAVIPAQVNQYNVRVAYSFTPDRKVALLAARDVCLQVDLSLSPDLPVPEAGLPNIRAEALIGIHDVTVSADGRKWAASKNIWTTFGVTPAALVGTWQEGVPVIKNTISLPATTVGHVALSPNGETLAVSAEARIVGLYDLRQETPVVVVNPEFSYTVQSTASNTAVTAGMSGTLQLQRLENESTKLMDRRTTDHGMYHICVSEDGRRAVSFSLPGASSRLQIWDISENRMVEGPSFDVPVSHAFCWQVLFRKGTRLQYANQIWDVSTSPVKVIATFSKIPVSARATAVSSNDQMVAFVGDGNRLEVFRTDQSAEDPIASTQLESAATSLAFSPDGTQIVTTHNGPVCIVWELKGNQISEVARMPSFSFDGFSGMYHTTTSVFSGDGKSVFIGAWGDVIEWRLDDNSLGRHWSIPGFTWLSRTDDGQHLIFNNSNTTTWILRLTEP